MELVYHAVRLLLHIVWLLCVHTITYICYTAVQRATSLATKCFAQHLASNKTDLRRLVVSSMEQTNCNQKLLTKFKKYKMTQYFI